MDYRALFDVSIEELIVLIRGLSKFPQSIDRDNLLRRLIDERIRSIRRTESTGIDFKKVIIDE